MSKSRFSAGFRILGSSVLGLVLLLSGGCADILTYSKDAQREGLTLYQQGDYANAAGAFKNSVKQNPQNYQGYYYLGECYVKLGQYQQAIAALRTARGTQAISTEGKYDDETREKINLGLATAIAKSDQRDIETDAAVQTAETHNNAADWFLVAKVFEIRGDADSALDAYNRAAIMDSKNFLIIKDYGLYCVKIGQTQRAETALRRAYNIKSDDNEVILALRKIGVVPGPSLIEDTAMSRSIAPIGQAPITTNTPNPAPSKPAAVEPTVAAPRD